MTARARKLWIFTLVLVRRREEAESEESRGSESERTTARGGEKKAEERMTSMRRAMDRTSAEPSTRTPSPGRTAVDR